LFCHNFGRIAISAMEIFIQLLFNGLIAGAAYTLITLGFNFIYGTTRFVNMAHGLFAAVGGYVTFVFLKILGWPIILATIIGALGAGLVSWLSDRLIFRSLRNRGASNLVLFIASLGLFIMLQSLIAVIFGNFFHGLFSSSLVKTFLIFGGAVTNIQLIIFIVAAVVIFGLALLRRTVFGKSVAAISDDIEVAKMVGINTDRVIGAVFFIGGTIAGLAGILIGMDTGIYPGMGLLILLEGAIAAIVGGIGNLYGGVAGAFVLGLVENFGIWKIPSEWKPAIAVAVLVIFLIFRPQGIMKK
jgi:branched-chain amino acid transport system permease protein